MALTLRDKEILSYSEKRIKDKTNMLGADGYHYAEPFYTDKIVALSDTMRQKPATQDGYGLVAPNYDDHPTLGSVGTRRTQLRLYPYLPSGKDGPDSVQTFIAVSTAPASNSVSDIEAVRIKPLISPRFSPDAQNAATTLELNRGFELALYPALDSTGTLAADTSAGPIAPAADPSGSTPAGADNDGMWYVDYENGIVRFSVPPLNGSSGVMNPNNVFGDYAGATDASGAVTMFATYYEYTGEYGASADNFVTVGDGYRSEGTYEGENHNVVQSALDTFNAASGKGGGTVFLKEGHYRFTDSVTLPPKTRLMGSPGTIVYRPDTLPAFIINDGYCEIDAVEIRNAGPGTATSGGAIELRNTSAGQTIYNTKLTSNDIETASGAPGIGVGPLSACTYHTLDIRGNTFGGTGDSIADLSLGGAVDVSWWNISENLLGRDASAGDISLATDLDTVNGLMINNNVGAGAINVTMPTASNAANIAISNNIADSFSISNTGGAIVQYLQISSNIITNDSSISVSGGLLQHINVSGNVLEKLSIILGGSANLQFSNIANNAFIAPTGLAGLLIDGVSSAANTMDGCNVSDNVSRSSIDIQGARLTSCVISGNITEKVLFTGKLSIEGPIANTVCANNTCVGDDMLISSAASALLSDSIFVGNSAQSGDIVIGNSGTADSSTVSLRSVVTGNTADNMTAYGSSENSVFSNNSISSTTGLTLKNLLESMVIANVVPNGNITFTSADDSLVTGNMAVSVATSGTPMIDATVISNNSTSGALTVYSATDSTLGNNSSDSINITNGILRTSVANNSVATLLSIESTSTAVASDRSSISGNVGAAGATLQVRKSSGNAHEVLSSMISGNIFDTVTIGGTIVPSGVRTLEQSSVAGNWCDDMTIGNSANNVLALSESSIDGNFLDGYFTLNGGMQSTGIDSNVFSEGVGIFGHLVDSLMLGNVIPSTVGSGIISDGITISNSVISNNTFGSNLELSSGSTYVLSGSSFDGNIMPTSDLDILSQGSVALFNSRIINSGIETIIIDCNGTSASNLVAASSISNNDVQKMQIGLATASDNVTIFDNSIVANNLARGLSTSDWVFGKVSRTETAPTLTASVISNNIGIDELEVNGTISTSEINYNSFRDGNGFMDINGPVLDSQLNGNNLQDIDITRAVGSSPVLSNVVINDNLFQGSLSVQGATNSTIVNSQICNNKASTTIALDTAGSSGTFISTTIISNNVVLGPATIGVNMSTAAGAVLSNCIVESNSATNFTIGSSGRANTVDTVDESIIVNNAFSTLSVRGEILESVISNNMLDGFNVGDIQGSSVSANVFESSAAGDLDITGSITETIVEGNLVSGGSIKYGTTGETVTRLMSIGNYSESAMGLDADSWTDCIMSNNVLTGGFTQGVSDAISTWTNVAFVSNSIRTSTLSFRNTVLEGCFFGSNVGGLEFIRGAGATGTTTMLSNTSVVGHQGAEFNVDWQQDTTGTIAVDGCMFSNINATQISFSSLIISSINHTLINDSVISGCYCDTMGIVNWNSGATSSGCSGTAIVGNHVSATMSIFGNSLSGVAVALDSQIINNYVAGLTFIKNTGATSGIVLDNVMINNNMFVGGLMLGIAGDTSIINSANISNNNFSALFKINCAAVGDIDGGLTIIGNNSTAAIEYDDGAVGTITIPSATNNILFGFNRFAGYTDITLDSSIKLQTGGTLAAGTVNL